MRVHRLTDISISAIRPPSSGQVVYRDAASPLQLRVSAGGSKTFYVVVGQGRRHTIGRFGEVTLAHARDVARRIKAEKTLGRYAQNSVPVERARAEYLGQILVRSNTRTYYERYLNKLTGKLTDLKTGDINRVLDALGTTSRNQALAAFRAFFKWCVRRNYLERSPVEKLTPTKTPPRTRLLTDDEIRSIWNACDDIETRALDDAGFSPNLDRTTRSPGAFSTIVKLLILTGQRRNEIASLRAVHIKDGVCTLPSALTKNKRDHAIPLGACAISIISSHASRAGLLFPARGSRETSFNGWSKSKTALDRRLGRAVEPWTLHDIRRYYSSTMARLGVRLEVTERLLNHVSGTQSGVAGIYNRHTYFPEMREAVDSYERHIQQLVVG
jgi:integrase